MRVLSRLICSLILCVVLFAPASAVAGGLIDMMNLAPFVPNMLEVVISIASSTYEYFVGSNGRGPLFILIWGGTAISMGLYLAKMYFPKNWGEIFGFTGGGEMWGNGIGGMTVAQNVLKPGFRAILAVLLFLQIRPVLIVDFLVNPFLELGSVYTEYVIDGINIQDSGVYDISCPPEVVQQGWLSERSCDFLIKPVAKISNANNRVVERGWKMMTDGLRGLITLIPHGGQDFMNIVTGLILVFTFVSSNIFMVMIILQGIFNFGMSLMLYPFQVLTYVFKSSDKWFDVWPAFSGVVKALQDLVITIIAAAFMLAINVAVVRALFPSGTSVYSDVAGGSATGNVPMPSLGMEAFGQQSITILSALLTFYLMLKIFQMTQDQLKQYAKGLDGMHKSVVSDAKSAYGTASKGIKWIKNLRKK